VTGFVSDFFAVSECRGRFSSEGSLMILSHFDSLFSIVMYVHDIAACDDTDLMIQF